MLLNLPISGHKYPKIATHVKKIHVQTSSVLLKTTAFFLQDFCVVFSHKCNLVKTGEGNVMLDLAI